MSSHVQFVVHYFFMKKPGMEGHNKPVKDICCQSLEGVSVGFCRCTRVMVWGSGLNDLHLTRISTPFNPHLLSLDNLLSPYVPSAYVEFRGRGTTDAELVIAILNAHIIL